MKVPLMMQANAAFYTLSQRLVGADEARRICIDALGARAGDRIVDIGCGPAYYLDRLPPCDYHGFDTDAARIASARARFGDKGHFYDEPFDEAHALRLAPFDGALLLGLLHHIDDEQALALLDLLARTLKPNARVITLDTAFYEGQSTFARMLAKNDRGDFVRNPRWFQRLAETSFERVEARILGDTLRMPASAFMMILEGPRQSRPAT